MTTPPSGEPSPFAVEAHQNVHLVEGGGTLEAVLTVTAAGELEASRARLLLGFVIDVSGSMDGPRMQAVISAVQTAIGLLDDRNDFFVVTFSDRAQQVVMPTTAKPAARQRAIEAVDSIHARGGTAMSQGLAMARSVFAVAPTTMRQCVFLTDGKNESESRQELEVELRRCAGVFSCDCWGVGTDWLVGEVQQIAGALSSARQSAPRCWCSPR